MNTNPRVSICTTFFNAERYIHRLLESCIGQTYKNIEIVVVDGASTDGSEAIVRKYTARDPRIKYVRCDENVGLTRSLVRATETAAGDLLILVGADDWLATDFIEKGVSSFQRHPETAGIMPHLISLSETEPGRFTLLDETVFSQQEYSAEWFAKNIYKPLHLYITALALMRRSDALAAMRYFLEHYCADPPASTPDELVKFFWGGFGIDAVMFLEILTRHKGFVFDDSLHYLKVAHGANLQFDMHQKSLFAAIKYFYYYLLTYSYMYRAKWPKYFRGMKLYLFSEALSSVFMSLFRLGPRSFRSGEQGEKEAARAFFEELSSFEMIVAACRSFARVIVRSVHFILKKFLPKTDKKAARSRIFIAEHFLDQEGRFVAV